MRRAFFRPTPVALLIAALASRGISLARADTPPAPTPAAPSPKVTPPVALSDTDVAYPASGNGDAIVSLILDVDREGNVASAVVTDGAAPFAEQARRAVLAWKFTPAHRGDVAVGARIRARVAFHQDAEPAPGPIHPSPPSSSTVPSAKPSASTSSVTLDDVEDVTVRGTRHEIGETTLTADDVREMPGAFGDPFRAIEALPGVVPVVSGLPFFYIRGAPPTDNAYLIDGIKVPILFHVGIGEAVIHPALIDHVDFFPGAAPASYGGMAGAVIAGQTREPATKPHGQVDVRLIDAGALVESPLADGRATVLAAARYGYPGPILGAVTSDIKLGYWDYQTRATLRVGDRDTLGVFAFGSHDYLGTGSTQNGVQQPITDVLISDFHRVDLRYDHKLSGGTMRVATTLGYDSLGGTGGRDSSAAVTAVKNLSVGARLEIEKDLSSTVRFRGGADVHLEHWSFAEGEAPLDPSGTTVEPQVPSSANPPPTNLTWGAHADVVWKLGSRVEIVPGARFDVFDSARENLPPGTRANTMVPAFDPRLSARVKLTSRVAWLSSFALSHQYPVLRVGGIPAMLVSVPGFPVNGSELQTAAQASQGVEIRLPFDFTLATTAFLSGRTGLTDLTANCQQLTPAVSAPSSTPTAQPYACPNDGPVHQRAYGVELLLRRPLSKRLSGWISYTLSRATGQEHFLTPTGGTAVATVVNDYDRTHVLNAMAGYDLGRRWRAGARFILLSGTTFSNLAGDVPVAPYNAQRNPFFYRVDVRLEKRWPFLKTGYIAFIAEVQNVTLNKERTPFGVDCEGSPNGTNKCTQSEIGPITIPSIGIQASF